MDNTVTEERVNRMISKTEYQIVGKKTTICCLTLNNGFEVIGTSACVDPKNFDVELGEKFAREAAFSKVEELEGYRLQSSIAYNAI